MVSDDKEPVFPLRISEVTGRNIIPLESRAVLDDEQSRETIRRMAEFGNLTPAQIDELGIIRPGMRNSMVLNAFRELRTKIYQRAGGRENFVVMVTSLTPGGGGSFVTTNLGAAIALDESKTAIIVDCNIYDPSLHRVLPVEPDYGLVDYLENITIEVKDIIYSTGIRRLRMIPVGSNRQMGHEYFTSSRMRRFVDELRARYRDRHIVVDAPSIYNSADARIIADLCDYILIVVPFGSATQAEIYNAVEALGEHKVIGVVFNN